MKVMPDAGLQVSRAPQALFLLSVRVAHGA
jgi:hypothetical protein